AAGSLWDVVRDRRLNHRPEVVEKFQKAAAQSLAYADAHPDEARETITTYTKIPADVLAKVTLPKWPAEPNRASIEALMKLGRSDGLFKTDPNLDELLP
ncbi:ABC transporter substrate-binding protein, partial [Streptomyces nigra]